jgi:threonylcarbamoyladenosine tRNA methylthiotransferase MtaB
VSVQPPAQPQVRRAAISNLGCRVNQAEMAALQRLLRSGGVELVDERAGADLVVVNTCTVTSIADRKSRQLVRRARRDNPNALVIVTGCSASIDPGSIRAADPQARLFDNESKARLVDELADLLAGWGLGRDAAESAPAADSTAPADSAEAGEWAEAVDSAEAVASDRTRAYVKVQDGCSLFCTYCIVPRARGPERSSEPSAVIEEVRAALAAGHREVVLTGINVGAYRAAGLDLAGLVRRLLAETGVERVRLSSVEPQHLTDELLDVWRGSAGRCLPHFHMPLQSGDDAILRRMGRRYLTRDYAALVARVRLAIPGAAVHADLIAGFPGEDEGSWERTLDFVRGLELAGIHVFRYSARPGTPATRMVGQVDPATRKRRAAEALALAARARAGFAERQIGSTLGVLFERRRADGRWLGHAENNVLVAADSPDRVPLDNAVGRVVAESIDPAAPDTVIGRLADSLAGSRETGAQARQVARSAPSTRS